MSELEILYEDRELLVCRKESGIPVQTAHLGQQDMVSLLMNYRVTKKETAEIYIVHRLDQPVEGIMVFAKDKKTASRLNEQVCKRTVDKYYQAVADAVPQETEGVLEDWLLKDGRRNSSKVVMPHTSGAKMARLSYRVLSKKQGKSLLEICLETGRHHQIRVQLAHAGYPLTGDKKYNVKCASGYLPIGLCSTRLSFTHPKTGKRMEFTIEPRGGAFQLFSKD